MKLFLSYRRNDTAYIVGRVRDRLVEHFGEDSVYTDVDNPPLGMDFAKRIEAHVAQCDVLLAAIGADWLNIIRSRQDDPNDYVRIEIESALNRDIPVIPLLVRGGSVPEEDELPLGLRELAVRQGLQIRRDPDFHSDVDRLIKGLEQQRVVNKPDDQSLTQKIPVVVGLILVVLGFAWYIYRPPALESPPRVSVSTQESDHLQVTELTVEDRLTQLGDSRIQMASQTEKYCEGSDGIVAIQAFAMMYANPDSLADYIKLNAPAFAGNDRALGCLSALMAKAEVNRAADPTQIDPPSQMLLNAGPTFEEAIRSINEGRSDEALSSINKNMADAEAAYREALNDPTITPDEQQLLIQQWKQQNELLSNIMKSMHDMAMTPIRNMR